MFKFNGKELKNIINKSYNFINNKMDISKNKYYMFVSISDKMEFFSISDNRVLHIVKELNGVYNYRLILDIKKLKEFSKKIDVKKDVFLTFDNNGNNINFILDNKKYYFDNYINDIEYINVFKGLEILNKNVKKTLLIDDVKTFKNCFNVLTKNVKDDKLKFKVIENILNIETFKTKIKLSYETKKIFYNDKNDLLFYLKKDSFKRILNSLNVDLKDLHIKLSDRNIHFIFNDSFNNYSLYVLTLNI